MSAGLTKNGELRVSISGHSAPTPWFVTAHENSSTPASPVAGDRILFPKNDGWYDLDYAGNVRALVLGTGVAGRITEWNSPTELGSSTLIKSGAGVLTLSAAGDYTLTVPATGTAALLAADNAFSGSNTLSGTVNTIAPGGLRLGTPISQTPTQGGIIARGAGSLVNHGFFSAYWNFYFAANAYHDGTGWKALATNDGTNGYSALFRSDIGGLGAALIVEADSTLRTAGDTRTYTTILSLEFDGQLQLPVSGSSAGILLGGDALLYRDASGNMLRTPDSLTVDVGLNVGSATGATTGMIITSGDVRFQNGLEAGLNAGSGNAFIQGYNRTTPAFRGIEVWSNASLTALFDTSRNTTLYGGLNVGSATGATSQGIVEIKADSGANPSLRLLDGDVSHPFTSPALTPNMFGNLTTWAGAAGGLLVQSISDTDSTSFGVVARVGATTTTLPAIAWRAGKSNGSGGTASLASTEIHTRWENNDGTVIIATMYGNGTIITTGYMDAMLTDSATNTITNGVVYRHRTSGTPAANFGTSMFAIADTNGQPDQTLFYVPSYWTDATNASRKSRTDFYAYDSVGARLAYSIGANGSTVLMGFFGTAPIAKPTGVAVTAAGIHAALVSLGLIAA